MHYTPGTTFVYNVSHNTQRRSVQEQLAIGRKPPVEAKGSSQFDPRLQPGHTYTINSIRRAPDSTNVVYKFQDLTESGTVIDITFSDTARADDYIAAMSGRVSELSELRNEQVKVERTLDAY